MSKTIKKTAALILAGIMFAGSPEICIQAHAAHVNENLNTDISLCDESSDIIYHLSMKDLCTCTNRIQQLHSRSCFC